MKISKYSPIFPSLAALMLAGTALAEQPPQPHMGNNSPPVAGVATGVIGVTVDEVMVITQGWSMKRHILGHPVYNDRSDRLGKIEDVIVSPDKAISWAIIGTGGFLGIAQHDVAIPINQLKIDRDRFLLPGATREVIRAMPEFHYSR